MVAGRQRATQVPIPHMKCYNHQLFLPTHSTRLGLTGLECSNVAAGECCVGWNGWRRGMQVHRAQWLVSLSRVRR